MSCQTAEAEDKQKKKEIKKSLVDHTYRDYSRAVISDLVVKSSPSNKEIFPSKLHEILSKPEYKHIIDWRPHGRAWAVKDRALFISVVLPKFFNHSSFSSFNRSVNGWGFKRLQKYGPDRNSYYHELFLAEQQELAGAMTRLVNPGKRLPNTANEPDFYDISRRYPLSNPPVSSPYRPTHNPGSGVGGVPRGIKQAPIPIYMSPPAAKHLFCGPQQVQQETRARHPYGPPLIYQYQQTPVQSWLPPYSHPSQNNAPPNYGTYHASPGQFHHQFSHNQSRSPSFPNPRSGRRCTAAKHVCQSPRDARGHQENPPYHCLRSRLQN